MKKIIYLVLTIFSFCITSMHALSQQKSEANNGFIIEPKGLKISFSFFKNRNLRLISFLPEGVLSTEKFPGATEGSGNEVFLQCTGENQAAHHGTKFTGSNPGEQLHFIEKNEVTTSYGRQVVITQYDSTKKLKVESFYEYNNSSPTVRRYTKVTNESIEAVGIEYLSSAILNNFYNTVNGTAEDNIRIHFAYNSWKSEAQWHKAKPSELGWNENNSYNVTGAIFSNIGSWSTVRYLPMGMIENTKTGITWFWQIEHNGSWYTEISNLPDQSNYLYLGGPDAIHSNAWKNLLPGQSYQTVPVALGCVKGGFDDAVAALTQYRRAMVIKPHTSYSQCPVIFNDYMNCLSGDPTTEKEIPLVDAAAKADCDYYVIDAGWYAEKNESWWDAVGLWQPSVSRFSGGLQQVLNYIKQKGMVPGLWLEPEVAGINSPLKNKPDKWFLMQHGKRIIDNGRFILDFRNPEVTTYITGVVDRMVKEYGVGYIKMDYNNSAWGTETNASSAGQGLLEHNRAVVNWFKTIGDKYPQLVVENCGSGGLRMDYAMLSQTQVQSSSDQENYKKYPAILVGAMAAVVPEQLAVWSYPTTGSDAKEASFNMVSAMLCRIEQSGNLDKLSSQSLEQVIDGIKIYKSVIAPIIHQAVPFFPLGMPSIVDDVNPIAVGLKNGNKNYIAVWRLKGEKIVKLPSLSATAVKLIYPATLNIQVKKTVNDIEVEFPDEYMAVLIEVLK